MKLISLNTGHAAPMEIEGRNVLTGIRKTPRSGAVALATLGLEGDEQADPSVHGGLSKAVYAYPSEHYEFWQAVRAQAQVAAWGQVLPPGSLGENLTLGGLLEKDAFVGDTLRFVGGVELLVSEPRFPCFKFNAVMGFNKAAKLMAQSRWCGFYLAVKTPGTLAAGEAFELLPGPRELSIPELFGARMKG